jgi:hypothetical protein
MSSGPLEMVGDDDAPSCADGVCELPVADDGPLDD